MSDKKAFCGCGAVFYVPHWQLGNPDCPACVRAEKATEASRRTEAQHLRENFFSLLVSTSGHRLGM